MKKIPVFTSILLMAGVLATMAFSHPLVVRNGPVSSYSAGSDITIHNHGLEQTFFIRQGTTMLPQGAESGLAAGARVTVVAACYHTGTADRNAPASSSQNQNGQNKGQTRNGNFKIANEHPCIALAIFVRSAASGAVPATGGTGSTGTAATSTATSSTGATGTTGTATATSAPNTGATTGAATETATPAATGTTAGTATGTMMVCPTMTATPTGTMTPTATPSTTGATATATATMLPCVTATATP